MAGGGTTRDKFGERYRDRESAVSGREEATRTQLHERVEDQVIVLQERDFQTSDKMTFSERVMPLSGKSTNVTGSALLISVKSCITSRQAMGRGRTETVDVWNAPPPSPPYLASVGTPPRECFAVARSTCLPERRGIPERSPSHALSSVVYLSTFPPLPPVPSLTSTPAPRGRRHPAGAVRR